MASSILSPDPRGVAGTSTYAIPASAPGACPVCGARSLAPEGASSALLAVCDVLVVKTLETLGKRIIRADRTRFRTFGSRPWHEAHTIWPASRREAEKSLARAWDVVPALLDTHGCCGATSAQVSEMLDEYVTDLATTGTPHTIGELHYRFESRLGLPVYLMEGSHRGA